MHGFMGKLHELSSVHDVATVEPQYFSNGGCIFDTLLALVAASAWTTRASEGSDYSCFRERARGRLRLHGPTD